MKYFTTLLVMTILTGCHSETEYTWTADKPYAGGTSPTTFTIRVSIHQEAGKTKGTVKTLLLLSDKDGPISQAVGSSECDVFDDNNWQCQRWDGNRFHTDLCMRDGKLMFYLDGALREMTKRRKVLGVRF